jgi:hypothetical protein
MRFHAKYVSVGESDGEYFAVSFDNEDPSNNDFELSDDEDLTASMLTHAGRGVTGVVLFDEGKFSVAIRVDICDPSNPFIELSALQSRKAAVRNRSSALESAWRSRFRRQWITSSSAV